MLTFGQKKQWCFQHLTSCYNFHMILNGISAESYQNYVAEILNIQLFSANDALVLCVMADIKAQIAPAPLCIAYSNGFWQIKIYKI